MCCFPSFSQKARRGNGIFAHKTARWREELQAADRQARLLHQLTMVGQFTAGFMHEFNNPFVEAAESKRRLVEHWRKKHLSGNEVLVKSSAFFLPAAAVLLVVAVTAATVVNLPPARRVPVRRPPGARIYPAPTNLKVLPKDLTGQQIHEIMEQWSGRWASLQLLPREDRNNIGPNGRPRLNFADDSKPMKDTARLMFTMTEKINTDYVAMIDSSGAPVTCGTCHRGHLGPEPFKIQPPDGPPTPQVPPSGEEKATGAMNGLSLYRRGYSKATERQNELS